MNAGRPFARMTLAACAMLLAIAPPAETSALAQPPDWGQFLGPNRDGRSAEKGLNLDWKAKPPPTRWRQPLGCGYASVIAVGDRLYTMAQLGPRDGVVCLDAASGRGLWTFEGPATYVDRQRQGRGPRATPTYRDGRLYCLFPRGDLFCLDAAKGKELWRANIFALSGAKEPFGEVFYWGVSGSPLVEGGRVIVQPGGKNGRSVLALDAKTGKPVWTAGDDPIGYSSPIAIDAAGRRQLVVATGSSLLGIAPDKGEVLWRYAFGNATLRTNCATPIWTGEVLFYSSAYGGGAVALTIEREAGKVVVRERWKNKKLSSQFATSMVLGDSVYGCDGDLAAITLRCLDLKTGELKWSERRPGKCSLLAAEGHLICLSEGGTLRLIEATPKEYTPKGELTDLLGSKAWAAPTLHRGRLYLRDENQVICVDLKKP